MKYAGIIKNDVAAGEGVCVTFFCQGCDRHCPGCHNPETWDFDGGYTFTQETLNHIINALNANGVQRNFCIMGGEPLHPQNLFLTDLIITEVKKSYPKIKIYVWTGYTYEQLLDRSEKLLYNILENVDVLVDGPFIQEQRDITLPMRGSRNQRIIELKENKNDCNTLWKHEI